jgi:UPF0716 protein FxsA
MEISKYVGLWETIIVIISTGIIGATLAKNEGLRTLHEIQENLTHGIIPKKQIADGVLLLIAGILLLLPGILSDVAGFLLVIPSIRTIVRDSLIQRLENKVQKSTQTYEIVNEDSDVIIVEWEEI